MSCRFFPLGIQASYKNGLKKYLSEQETIEYDQPVPGDTQAFSYQPNLLAQLPQFYLLPAIADYSDEINRRSTTTIFRRLMADLADRLLRNDPQYSELERTLANLDRLLNPATGRQKPQRLQALTDIETTLQETISRLMPSVEGVQLTVEVEEPNDIFFKGVSINVDDGALTDVLAKGHGMQRSIIFALLQILIERYQHYAEETEKRSIILGIEEPELYIHPHAQRLIYQVLEEFAGLSRDADGTQEDDQVIYTTHSPAFVDISRYERIGVVRKNRWNGTVVKQCGEGALGSPEEEATFKLVSSFGLKQNELFFAQYCIIVEGIQDEFAIIGTVRKLGVVKEFPEEIGISIVVAGGKGNIPKFQKILNEFRIAYGVLLELDGFPEDQGKNKIIIDNQGENCHIAKIPNKLEDIFEIDHFANNYEAKIFFSDPTNINEAMESIVEDLLPSNFKTE